MSSSAARLLPPLALAVTMALAGAARAQTVDPPMGKVDPTSSATIERALGAANGARPIWRPQAPGRLVPSRPRPVDRISNDELEATRQFIITAIRGGLPAGLEVVARQPVPLGRVEDVLFWVQLATIEARLEDTERALGGAYQTDVDASRAELSRLAGARGATLADLQALSRRLGPNQSDFDLSLELGRSNATSGDGITVEARSGGR